MEHQFSVENYTFSSSVTSCFQAWTTVTFWLQLLEFVRSIIPLKASITLKSSNNLSSCAYLLLGNNAVIYVKCLG